MRLRSFLQDQGGGMTRYKRKEVHLRSMFQQGIAFFRIQSFQGVISAFDICIGRERIQFGGATDGIKHQNRIHATQGCQQKSPVESTVYRAPGTFERTHRVIRIKQDQQSVRSPAGSQQIFRMTAVQNVKTAVGYGQTETALTQMVAPLNRRLQ